VTVTADGTLLETIAEEASAESPLWAEARLVGRARRLVAVFSPLAPDPGLALGVETIYEGYLVHYGASRLFSPADEDTALLLGDALYAQGLVHVASTGDVAAVHDLAELLSLCAQGRADGRPGDGAAWAATAALLGRGGLEAARAALRDRGDALPLELVARDACGDGLVDAALALHGELTGDDAPSEPVR
jgi:hypothetical protein